jgi:hypothetical protein
MNDLRQQIQDAMERAMLSALAGEDGVPKKVEGAVLREIRRYLEAADPNRERVKQMLDAFDAAQRRHDGKAESA